MRDRRDTMIGATGLALIAAIAAAAAALWPARQEASLEAPTRADASGPPRVAVTDIRLGRAVGLDKRVADPADTFARQDTVYASVVTEGQAEHVQLTARFTRAGAVLAEVSQGIAPTGTAVSEFNVWKPRGLPAGEYELEVLVDGVAAGTRRFTVR
jgi:hypothetical protein